MGPKRVQVRLYRFFNIDADKYGEPFALCDGCKPKQPIPESCILSLIAIGAIDPCDLCGTQEDLLSNQ